MSTARRLFSVARLGPVPVTIALVLLLVTALVALAGSPGDVSRFQRTARSVAVNSPEMKADFAAIALGELLEVYLAEADLARKQASQLDDGAKLLGWSRAVDQYAGQLALLLQDIDQGFPTELSLSSGDLVAVTVADRTIILGHPRADQQAALQQRVLLDFCGRHDCELLTANDIELEPIPVSVPAVRPDWQFTGSGPICSSNGIEVRFGSRENLARYRGICQQLLGECLTLAAEIAWQRRHGVSVDWQGLLIRPTPGRPEHLVQLNTAGDSILVSLPLIYRSPGLLQSIEPWLQARFVTDQSVIVRLNAGEFGWE